MNVVFKKNVLCLFGFLLEVNCYSLGEMSGVSKFIYGQRILIDLG